MSVQVVKATQDEGVSQYYIAKIEELESALRDKKRNLRRLEAQRNELNAKGNSTSETEGFNVLIVVCILL
jgi:26S proteasome regulatory subunit T6